jgi:hypothetical protein
LTRITARFDRRCRKWLIDGKRLSVMVDNASNDYYSDVNELYTAINRSSSETGAVLDTSVLFLMQR